MKNLRFRTVATALALEGVLRVKGFARVKDRPAPVVVQAVGGRVELSFARPDAAAVIVDRALALAGQQTVDRRP